MVEEPFFQSYAVIRPCILPVDFFDTFLGDFLGGVEESDVDLCSNVPVPYHKVPFYPTVCNADRLYDNVDHLCNDLHDADHPFDLFPFYPFFSLVL